MLYWAEKGGKLLAWQYTGLTTEKKKKNIAEVAKAILLTIIFSSYSLQATI